MNSRERILAAINRQPIDRIPTDIWATPEVFTKLRAHFGSDADMMVALHIDGFASAAPDYIGPPLPKVPGGESVDYWGIRTKRVAYGTGVYDEQSYCPLADAETVDDLDAYAWPQVSWFDFSHMVPALQKARTTKVTKCGYMAPFYCSGDWSSL